MNEHTNRTQGRAIASRGLQGVREAAQRDKGLRFTTLLHHVNEKLLLEGFYLLKRQAAPGVDRVTWGEYEEGVEVRIADLHDRIHRGALATSGAGSLCLSGDKVTFAASPRGQRSRHGEFTSRNRMGGNAHWESRHWKTKSCSRLWSRSSIRFMRGISPVSRMVFGRGAARTVRWIRLALGRSGKGVLIP